MTTSGESLLLLWAILSSLVVEEQDDKVGEREERVGDGEGEFFDLVLPLSLCTLAPVVFCSILCCSFSLR